MLVTLKELLEDAQKKKYAIGSFNLHNMEMLPSFFEAAKETKTPISIQISNGTAKYIGLDLIVSMTRTLAERENVKVALHLDHNSDLDFIKKAVDAGFTSVMFDGAHLPLEENIRLTKDIVQYAHKQGVSVEAEVGAIGGTEDGVSVEHSNHTDPEEAAYFYKETNVDALAVSFGSAHGQYRSKAALDFDVLHKIYEAVDAPLVLHGGTGVSYDDIGVLIENGISKINIGTILNVTYIEKGKETFSESSLDNSLRNLLIPCNDKVKEIIKEKIYHFNNNRALAN
ncbi:fructose-bisphosphate aldolase [Halobacillus karajensis]|uniref:class II fructose-bisphosphate aldolase n=1 Tax=Halobacillus karajensis TaxID=195088 RepID=UPI0008A8090B|nr:class II fructose-bisphosphate aldolase [Halobacillus karajensis]SEI13348.1 fructose-bisphosphate aldolase [Halobacillus karajensis]